MRIADLFVIQRLEEGWGDVGRGCRSGIFPLPVRHAPHTLPPPLPLLSDHVITIRLRRASLCRYTVYRFNHH